jgi:hypothetical protein
VFNRYKPQLDVYLAEFFPKGPKMDTPRRLTLDDADDLPFESGYRWRWRSAEIGDLMKPLLKRWSSVRNKKRLRG